jgi:hypothetical protein
VRRAPLSAPPDSPDMSSGDSTATRPLPNVEWLTESLWQTERSTPGPDLRLGDAGGLLREPSGFISELYAIGFPLENGRYGLVDAEALYGL